MDVVQNCEILMLVLFGCSWPFNIIKSWRSRTARGKSIGFEVIVLVGYGFGILGKAVTFRNTGTLPYSVWFYLLDIGMVLVDLTLVFRNKRLDKAEDLMAAKMKAKAA